MNCLNGSSISLPQAQANNSGPAPMLLPLATSHHHQHQHQHQQHNQHQQQYYETQLNEPANAGSENLKPEHQHLHQQHVSYVTTQMQHHNHQQQHQQQTHPATSESQLNVSSSTSTALPVSNNQHAQHITNGAGVALKPGSKPRGRRKKIRTEPIRPICPQCEKQFSNQSALTKHKLTHSDERRFACQQCSKAFKRHDHLTGHMLTHSNRKPYNCTIQGCDKTYCDARSLRRHKENIHHIVTPRDLNNSHNKLANSTSNGQHLIISSSSSRSSASSSSSSIPTTPTATTAGTTFHHPIATGVQTMTDLNNNTIIVTVDQQQQVDGIPQQQDCHHQLLGRSASACDQPLTSNIQMDSISHNVNHSNHHSSHQTLSTTSQQTCDANNNNCVPQSPHLNQNNRIQIVGQNNYFSNNGGSIHDPSTPLAPQSMDQPPSNRWSSNDLYTNPSHHHQTLSNRHSHLYVQPSHHHNHHNHHHLHHQPPFSADYATTQQHHFTFDFIAPTHSHNHHQQHVSANAPPAMLQQQQQHQHSLSTNNLNDLNEISTTATSPPETKPTIAQLTSTGAHHGGYLTPLTLHPPTPHFNSGNTQQQQTIITYQQASDQEAASQQQQPLLIQPSALGTSELLMRRKQRFHSAGSIQGTQITPLTCAAESTAQHQYQNSYNSFQASSADYNSNQSSENGPPYHDHHASFSADYATTQHFNFDFNQIGLDNQPLNSNTVLLSADSITDSGLGLNVQYEQPITSSSNSVL